MRERLQSMLLSALAPLLALAAIPSIAAEPPTAPMYSPVIERFDTRNGLPQNGVNAILQARDGWLWVGTFGGLARFDGERFFNYPSAEHPMRSQDAPDVADGPQSDSILALMQDDADRIWIGSQDSGVAVFDQDRFLHLPVCNSACQVTDFEQLGRTIWASSDSGLWRIDAATFTATKLQGFPDRYTSSVATTGNGKLYAPMDGKLAEIADDGESIREIAPPIGAGRVLRVFSEGDMVWVTTINGLYGYHTVRGEWLASIDARQTTGLDRDATYLLADSGGGFWYAMQNGSLWKRNESGESTLFWQGEAGSGITVLSRDKEANLWIGSSVHGLMRLRPSRIGLMPLPDASLNLSGNAVESDGGNGVYFGLSCGLWHWNGDDITQRISPEGNDTNFCITSLERAHDGTLWIGNISGKLMRLREPGQAVETVATLSNGPYVSAITQLPDGQLLVAARLGTYRIELDDNGEFTGLSAIPALDGMRIIQILPSKHGGTWFVGSRGAYRLGEDEIVERWTPAEGLANRFARALFEDDNGVTWIGTYGGGLHRIENGRLRNFRRSQGLYDDAISCLLPDQYGQIWMAGNRGVSVLRNDPGDAEFITVDGYSENEGLVPSELNGSSQSACHRDPQGRLWLALVRGFAVLDPARFERTDAPVPSAHVTGVAVNGIPHPLTDELRLPPSDSIVEVQYTAINLTSPERLHFRFRLSRASTDWIDAGSNRSIVFPSIPWGENVFEVQARNEDGPWSEPARLHIVRPSPWYQKPWLWLLATTLGLMLVVSATRSDDETENA